MNQKQTYTAPETEVFEVQTENLMSSSPAKAMLYSAFGDNNAAGAQLIVDDGYDF